MRQGRRVKIRMGILKSSSLDVAEGLEMFFAAAWMWLISSVADRVGGMFAVAALKLLMASVFVAQRLSWGGGMVLILFVVRVVAVMTLWADL